MIEKNKCFNPHFDEWGNNFYEEAKGLAESIRFHLDAMMSGGNPDDYDSTMYLFRWVEGRLFRLNQILPMVKNYIKEPKSINEIVADYDYKRRIY